MTNVIVVFPKLENAQHIKAILTKCGYHVAAVCTTGAQAVCAAESLEGGILVCGYKFVDMMYTQLRECLPEAFEMLLVASRRHWSDCASQGIVCLAMPVSAHELRDTMDMIAGNMAMRKKAQRAKPRQRSEKDKADIQAAKLLLMERNNMTEEEAHRYIQKCSMDSGTNMVETAQMILSLYEC